MARLNAGYVRSVNPYGGPPATVPLTPEQVDGFAFWTRNLEPFFPALAEVRARGYPFVVQYTITGYPRALDAATIGAKRAVGHLRRVTDAHGRGVAVWRYDPVVISSLTPPAWHLHNFAALCETIGDAVDEVVVSFAHIYRKTARNMAAAARAFHFDWRDPPVDEKRALLAELAGIAADHGLALTLCGQRDVLVEGVAEARCIDAEWLSRVAGRALTVPRKPHRDGCACWASRDIGDYDSCPHGCVYCYAVNSRSAAKRRFQRHDPNAEALIPPLRQTRADKA